MIKALIVEPEYRTSSRLLKIGISEAVTSVKAEIISEAPVCIVVETHTTGVRQPAVGAKP